MRLPWFRFRRVPWGTVYLLQSRKDASLFKVGFTKRKVIERREELNRVADDDMKVVTTITMPWARKCETLLLRRLRRNPFRKRDRRGTEWFRLKQNEDIHRISRKMEKAAGRIELIAKIQFSWPSEKTKRVFHSSQTGG